MAFKWEWNNPFTAISDGFSNVGRNVKNFFTDLYDRLTGKSTNESNEKNVQATNESNTSIAESTNQSNLDIANATNASNEAINAATNAANKDIQDSINAQNAANIEAQNKANKEIAESTNTANLEQVQLANDTNLAINAATNEMNKAISDENLAFQRENLEYQKALQQQVFEREDTAYQRTAYDMAQAGLNPLTMNGTNGSGDVVSTSAPQHSFVAQGATVNPAQFNGYTAMSANAQASRMTPYEKKMYSKVAHKLEAFQAQREAFDWLTNVFSGVGSGINNAISHGLQRDSLREQIKNNEVDRTLKLFDRGFMPYKGEFTPDYKSITENGHTKYLEGSNDFSNPYIMQAYKNAYDSSSYHHNLTYDLYNTSTDFERNVTGIQTMLDEHRLSRIGQSIKSEALDLMEIFSKMYNRSF